MNGTGVKPIAYARLAPGERQLHENPLLEGISSLRRFLPLSRTRFERLLGEALAEATRQGTGFYLGGFAARRALGHELILNVDPSILTHRVDHRFRHGGQVHNIREMFLGTGDWRPLVRDIARGSTHREVVEIVEAGFEYRKTWAYRAALEKAAGPKPVKRNFVALSSPAKVEAYFSQTAEMCRSIHRFGLLPRGDYGRRLTGFANLSVRRPWIEFGEVDIGIAIGAGGQLYRFASGKHRTAAAQALKLGSMPVEIRLVHAHWLARQMEETGLSPVDALRRGLDELRLAAR